MALVSSILTLIVPVLGKITSPDGGSKVKKFLVVLFTIFTSYSFSVPGGKSPFIAACIPAWLLGFDTWSPVASIVGATEKATAFGGSTFSCFTTTSAGGTIDKVLTVGATTLTLTLGAVGALGLDTLTLIVGALGAFGAVMFKASIAICPILGNLIVGASSGLAI